MLALRESAFRRDEALRIDRGRFRSPVCSSPVVEDEQRRRVHLDRLDRLIVDCAARIERQQQRVAHLKRFGLDSAKIAEQTLEAMRLDLDTLQATRETIKTSMERLL